MPRMLNKTWIQVIMIIHEFQDLGLKTTQDNYHIRYHIRYWINGYGYDGLVLLRFFALPARVVLLPGWHIFVIFLVASHSDGVPSTKVRTLVFVCPSHGPHSALEYLQTDLHFRVIVRSTSHPGAGPLSWSFRLFAPFMQSVQSPLEYRQAFLHVLVWILSASHSAEGVCPGLSLKTLFWIPEANSHSLHVPFSYRQSDFLGGGDAAAALTRRWRSCWGEDEWTRTARKQMQEKKRSKFFMISWGDRLWTRWTPLVDWTSLTGILFLLFLLFSSLCFTQSVSFNYSTLTSVNWIK